MASTVQLWSREFVTREGSGSCLINGFVVVAVWSDYHSRILWTTICCNNASNCLIGKVTWNPSTKWSCHWSRKMQVGNKIILILSQATIPGFFPLKMPGSAFGPGDRQKIFLSLTISFSWAVWWTGNISSTDWQPRIRGTRRQSPIISRLHFLSLTTLRKDNF